MAKIQGQLLKTEISTDDGTIWKVLICEQTSGSELTRETQTAPFTKCDTATNALQKVPLGYSWIFNFDALVDDAPATGQVTYSDMLTLFINATKFKVRRQYDSSGSDLYLTGDAYCTRLSETAPADGFLTFTGELSGTGALDIAP